MFIWRWSAGWVRTAEEHATCDVYERGGQEILIPRSSRLGDYASTVAELVVRLSEEEQDEYNTWRLLQILSR